MKLVEIRWDKGIFDGEKRLLPNSNVLYTQIYDVPNPGDAWSLVFEFKETPRIQGYTTCGTVRVLNAKLDDSFLVDGLQFEFLDGPKPLGVCTIIGDHMLEERILREIDNLDGARKSLNDLLERTKHFVLPLHVVSRFSQKCQVYPFLFAHMVKSDKTMAARFLEENFFKGDFFENLLESSGLLSYLRSYKSDFGSDEVKRWVESVQEEFLIRKLKENLWGSE